MDPARTPDTGRHYFGRPIGLALIAAYKLLWGVVESIAGILITFSARWIAKELIEDPQDIFANWVISHFTITKATSLIVGMIVLGFGLSKVLIAGLLWTRFRFVREVGVVFFLIVGVFGFERLMRHFSWVTVIGLFIEVLSLVYFLLILPKHLSPRERFE